MLISPHTTDACNAIALYNGFGVGFKVPRACLRTGSRSMDIMWSLFFCKKRIMISSVLSSYIPSVYDTSHFSVWLELM